MAKNERPTNRQLSIYKELAKKQNQVRKELIKLYSDNKGARNPRLPAIVIPEKATPLSRMKWSTMTKKALQLKIRQLKALYGKGSYSYFKRFKMEFIQAFRDAIDQYGDAMPEGAGGTYYTQEQMEQADSNIAGYMNLHNKFQRMSPTQFFDMYIKGYIVQFKYIYIEIKSKMTENSFLDEQMFNFNTYKLNQQNTIAFDKSTASNPMRTGDKKRSKFTKIGLDDLL